MNFETSLHGKEKQTHEKTYQTYTHSHAPTRTLFTHSHNRTHARKSTNQTSLAHRCRSCPRHCLPLSLFRLPLTTPGVRARGPNFSLSSELSEEAALTDSSAINFHHDFHQFPHGFATNLLAPIRVEPLGHTLDTSGGDFCEENPLFNGTSTDH